MLNCDDFKFFVVLHHLINLPYSFLFTILGLIFLVSSNRVNRIVLSPVAGDSIVTKSLWVSLVFLLVLAHSGFFFFFLLCMFDCFVFVDLQKLFLETFSSRMKKLFFK